MTKMTPIKQIFCSSSTGKEYIWKSIRSWKVVAGKMTRIKIELREAVYTAVRIHCVHPGKATQNLILYQIEAYSNILHHLSTMVGSNRRNDLV
jgi:hypothetical protein